MTFRFSIGQAVEYKPMGQATGRFKVIRHMPEEDNAMARKYLIKSLGEGFERIVHEFELGPLEEDERKSLHFAIPGDRAQ